ncbi:prepilin-type N-terminal cleavage/methylation domain-containing protein, partial [bacterium]|nr:prepilin-type N-terminal cleavage/methylation domain-containing protein [bacterium]
MKKGFTMIELLAVFTLTGIILLISFPQITSLLKKSNEEEYQTFLN